MLREAMEFIAEQVTAGIKPEVINPTNDPRTTLLVKPDGSYEKLAIPPALHAERLYSIEQLAQFVRDEMSDQAIVYCAFNGVDALYDREDRRDRAFCAVKESEQWRLISQGVKGKEFAQREFYKLLRVGFDGCLGDDRLISLVKAIKWQTSDTGASAVSNASHTMGRQLVQEVTGADAIPEQMTVVVPVWDALPLRLPIRCAVDVNPEGRTFSLTPFPSQIEGAMDEALKWLRGELSGMLTESVSVYIGAAK